MTLPRRYLHTSRAAPQPEGDTVNSDPKGKPVVYVDADACPVKAEIYRVAGRYGLKVVVVSNSWMRTPGSDRIELVVVEKGDGVADDWIAGHAGQGDMVVTGDIPLAARCLKNGSLALGNTGRPFTEDNIGDVLATRDLLTDLREQGMITRGPAPISGSDRSRFLQAMDEMVNRLLRRASAGAH